MANRFIALFHFPQRLYCENAPLLVSAGALMKDRQSGNIIIQMKFQSISEKKIQALIVHLVTYDASGEKIAEEIDHHYLDLRIANGQSFASDKAILVPNALTRSFAIENMKIVFSDSTIWKTDSAITWLEIPQQTPLSELLANPDLLLQYKLAVNQSAVFAPEVYHDLWRCSCGSINSCDECTSCRAQRENVISSFDIPTLTMALECRLKAVHIREVKEAEDAETRAKVQAREAEECEKIRTEEAKKHRMKRRKIGIISAIVVSTIAAVLFSTQWLMPNIISPHLAYLDAERLADDGDYSAAATAFALLEEYKDAPIRAKEASYTQAKLFLQMHDYGNAIKEFELLQDYSDASNLLREAKNAQADILLGKKDYIRAIALLESMQNDSDALKKANTIKYSMAEDLLTTGNYGAAAIAFYKLGDFQDSKMRSTELWNQVAVRDTVSASYSLTAGIKTDGTAIIVGEEEEFYQPMATGWTDLVGITAGGYGVFGLTSDGSILSAAAVPPLRTVTRDVVSIDYTLPNLAGVNADGTVSLWFCVIGSPPLPDVSEISGWVDIIAVSVTEKYIVGLKTDRTVVTAALDKDGQKYIPADSKSWQDIVSISASLRHTVGLKIDGTVVALGENDMGQCNTSDWTNVTAVSTGAFHTVGLKADGSVIAVGSNGDDQCGTSQWTDIVAISAGEFYTIGLKADGTVVFAGRNDDGRGNVSHWENMKMPNH